MGSSPIGNTIIVHVEQVLSLNTCFHGGIGRRSALKMLCPFGRVGSIPTESTLGHGVMVALQFLVLSAVVRIHLRQLICNL